MSKPGHQQFEVGPFIVYSHDYDGDILTIVKQVPDEKRPGWMQGFTISEADLVKKLEELHDAA